MILVFVDRGSLLLIFGGGLLGLNLIPHLELTGSGTLVSLHILKFLKFVPEGLIPCILDMNSFHICALIIRLLDHLLDFCELFGGKSKCFKMLLEAG